jgi:hypothetical protein
MKRVLSSNASNQKYETKCRGYVWYLSHETLYEYKL